MSGSAHHKVVGAQYHLLKLHYDLIPQVHMAVLSLGQNCSACYFSTVGSERLPQLLMQMATWCGSLDMW